MGRYFPFPLFSARSLFLVYARPGKLLDECHVFTTYSPRLMNPGSETTVDKEVGHLFRSWKPSVRTCLGSAEFKGLQKTTHQTKPSGRCVYLFFSANPASPPQCEVRTLRQAADLRVAPLLRRAEEKLSRSVLLLWPKNGRADHDGRLRSSMQDLFSGVETGIKASLFALLVEVYGDPTQTRNKTGIHWASE